jgi:hypothetical protein
MAARDTCENQAHRYCRMAIAILKLWLASNRETHSDRISSRHLQITTHRERPSTVPEKGGNLPNNPGVGYLKAARYLLISVAKWNGLFGPVSVWTSSPTAFPPPPFALALDRPADEVFGIECRVIQAPSQTVQDHPHPEKAQPR